MLPEFTREELASGLDCVAEEVLEEANIRHPPVDAFSITQAMGIAVALDDRQEGRARYVRLGNHRCRCDKSCDKRDSPIFADTKIGTVPDTKIGTVPSRATILIRPEPRFERQQWAVAHEIGEHVAYRVFARWGADPREMEANARERVANLMAGRLLLPTAWFEADAAECGWDLIALKARYHTASHELIARRMLECRPPVIISIFDHRRLSFRRSNVPGRVPSLFQAERECWDHVSQRHLPQQTREGPNLVQGWPIHEDGWEREILRTELAECEECEYNVLYALHGQ
jgi:hypothetical protein